MEYLSKDEQKKIEQLFRDGCKAVEAEDEYWVHGYDQGFSYCLKCAEKKCTELKKENPCENIYVDGAGQMEHSCIPYCIGCNCLLDGSLLIYGCRDKVNHFLENGFDKDDENDCYSMLQVLNSDWKSWDNNPDETDYYDNLHELCKRILNDLNKEK